VFLDDHEWFTLNNEDVFDIKEAIKAATAIGDKVVLIGTDSQMFERKIDFVTAIVIVTPGKGGRAFYTKEKNKKFNSLREKLVKETWMSVQVAMEIEPLLPESCDLAVHIDASQDKRWRSSKHVQELVGMVVGQGFTAVTKPRAFAASHVAEHIVKGRNIETV
jgi:predicted RNase H-related nuclease YkuK (DUF458 family)